MLIRDKLVIALRTIYYIIFCFFYFALSPLLFIFPSIYLNSLPFSFSEYSNFSRFIPSSLLGASGSILTPTAIDQFMLGSPSPLTQGDTPFVKNYENITGEIFAGRLTTLLNTIWQASIAPGNISLGCSANFSAIGSLSTVASFKVIEPRAQ